MGNSSGVLEVLKEEVQEEKSRGQSVDKLASEASQVAPKGNP
jgi:hypothetical protein